MKEGQGAHPFVRLRAKVDFTDLLTGRTRSVTLVEPGEADIDQDKVSVLTPIGAALVGLRAGDTFSWTTDGSRPRVLVINSVADAA